MRPFFRENDRDFPGGKWHSEAVPVDIPLIEGKLRNPSLFNSEPLMMELKERIKEPGT